MFKLRLAILGAAAALALGTAGAVAAMQDTGRTDAGSHGSVVSAAAHNCPHGANGVHGACVSAIANTEGQENNNSDSNTSGRATAPGQVCKAADATEATEPAGKDADKTEDRAEQRAFVACVTAHAAAQSGS
ncbi:MAG TPA: hypothetical protein VKE27_03255 [Candidatus Dormibacteraeota bacterium]|nr:hypothetical protein [Candidatus Dormibacteraeota bacterium]